MRDSILGCLIGFAAILFASQPAHGADSFGIVTSLKGHSEKLKVGQGIRAGEALILESNVHVGVTDIAGNQYTFLGGSEVEFKKSGDIALEEGAVLVRVNSDQGSVNLSSRILQIHATVGSTVAFWTGEDNSQAMSVQGKAEAFHPQLSESKITLEAGEFTAKEEEESFLAPHSAMKVSQESAKRFLEQFGNHEEGAVLAWVDHGDQSDDEDDEEEEDIQKPETKRSIASEAKEDPTAILNVPDFLAESKEPEKKQAAAPKPKPKNEAIERLKAHIQGVEYEEQVQEQEKKEKAIAVQKSHGDQKKVKYAKTREDSLRALVKGGNRKIASVEATPDQEKEKTVSEDEITDSAKPIENKAGIIQRIIHQKE